MTFDKACVVNGKATEDRIFWSSAVIKAKDRLKKEMVYDRKLPELIGKINSSFKG